MSVLFRYLTGTTKAPGQVFDRWPSPGTHRAPIILEDMKSAMRFVPVYAAVAMISELIACTPAHAYRRTPSGGRERVPDQPKLLTDPLPGFNRFVWVQQMISSILLRGNAYGLVLSTDKLGYPTQVRWLNPAPMRVEADGALPVYIYGTTELDRSNVVHVPGHMLPGEMAGLSPIGLFRTQIETGLSVNNYAGDWFDTGVAPTGHLQNTAIGSLNPVTAEAAKEKFREAVKNHDFFVSGSEWQWKPLTIPAQDAQFLEMMKASANEIAAIYRVAPEDVGGERGSSLTYKTLEQDELRMNRRTLLPWTTRAEAVLNQLTPNGQYVRFNLDAMVRADLKTRMESHQIALQTGLEVLDEARTLEDKEPLTAAEYAAWQEYQKTIKGGASPAPAPSTGETGQP